MASEVRPPFSPRNRSAISLYLPGNPDDAQAVVAAGTDRPRYMGPVPVVVYGVAVLIESIEAMNVIDDAIGVVVDPVTSCLRHIDPHVGSKILVAVADARIDHGHDRRRGIGPHIPGFGSVDIGIDGSSVLPVLCSAQSVPS